METSLHLDALIANVGNSISFWWKMLVPNRYPQMPQVSQKTVKNHANSLRHQEGLKLTLKNELGREACKKKKEKPYSDYPAFLFLHKKKWYRHWKIVFEQPRCSRLYLSCFWSYMQNSLKWLERSKFLFNFERWKHRQWCYLMYFFKWWVSISKVLSPLQTQMPRT